MNQSINYIDLNLWRWPITLSFSPCKLWSYHI